MAKRNGLNQFIEESEDSGVDIISICKRNNINPNDIEDIIEKVGELYYELMDELLEKSDFLEEHEYSKIAKYIQENINGYMQVDTDFNSKMKE